MIINQNLKMTHFQGIVNNVHIPVHIFSNSYLPAIVSFMQKELNHCAGALIHKYQEIITRESIVIRTDYWHGILPSLLVREG